MNSLPQVLDVNTINIAYDGVSTPMIRIATYGRGWWERSLPTTTIRSLQGTISLEGATNLSQPATFEFRPTDSSEPFRRDVTLRGNGSFFLAALPPLNYNVRIKSPQWLAKATPVDLRSADVSGFVASLRAGDANDDNSADALDLAVLINAFNTTNGLDAAYNQAADFNTDGSVDALDLALLIDNFNTEGDP